MDQFTEEELVEIEDYIQCHMTEEESNPVNNENELSNINRQDERTRMRISQRQPIAEYLDPQAWYFDSLGNVIYAPEESYLEVRAYAEKHNKLYKCYENDFRSLMIQEEVFVN